MQRDAATLLSQVRMAAKPAVYGLFGGWLEVGRLLPHRPVSINGSYCAQPSQKLPVSNPPSGVGQRP